MRRSTPGPGIVLVLLLLLLPAALLASPPGDEAPTPLFTDWTQETGLDFVHVNGMSGEFYMVENMGSGAALFDYDGDGDLDLYLVQGHPLPGHRGWGDESAFPTDRLFRNDLVVGADGEIQVRWVDVTAAAGIAGKGYGMGVATGDFDGDGWVDLYVTNWGPNHLLHNQGDGTFTDLTREVGADDPRWSVPALFFDFDGDGLLDLYVGNYLDFTLANHKPCVTLAGARDYCDPAAYRGESDRLLRNRGDGTFEDATARAGLARAAGKALGAVAADFNADGRLDLYVANDGEPNFLWVNPGGGTFREEALLAGAAVNGQGLAEASMGVVAADLDGDGDEDLFMTHLTTETHTLFQNQGDLTFEDGTAAAGLALPTWRATGFGVGALDYDNDGGLDLLMVNGAVRILEELARAGDPYPLHQPNQLFRNLGGGRFEEVTSRAGPAFRVSEVSRGAAFGDLDNDGDTDVVVTNNHGPARVLRNEVGQAGPWLGLRLLDAQGRRDLLGSRVAVLRREKPPLVRRVHTDGSYASASDPRVLVGLGTHPAVDRVRIHWVDGRVEEWSWRGLPVNRYAVFLQGGGRNLAGGGDNR